jgi:hypothetical protein
MPTRSSGPLLGGQTSFLLFITFFTFGMAAILVKVPPEMGGALVVGIIVFISTFMSAEAGLYLLIISMLLSPEFGAGGLGDGSDTTSSRGVTLRAEDILLVLLGFAWLARTAVNKGLGLIRPTPLNAPHWQLRGHLYAGDLGRFYRWARARNYGLFLRAQIRRILHRLLPHLQQFTEPPTDRKISRRDVGYGLYRLPNGYSADTQWRARVCSV